MAISDRISAMYDHVGEIYDTLELGGDTTQNKNIVNINTEIKREYKDFLANGTDVLWNNWEKVSGSGTEITLNNTMEGKMKVDLKGNTQQNGTPTPESPQDVHVVSGDNTIKVFGKNLYNRENGQYNVPIYATDGTSASYQDVNVVWVKVKPNTDYSFTLLPNSQTYFVRIIECTGDKGFIYRFPNNYQPGSGVANTLTITTPNNCEWLQIGINQYQTSQISQNNWEVMIEENATPSTYEPYQEQNYSVNLGTLELCKIRDYQDYLYKDSGKWYLEKKIGKVVLDGSEESWRRIDVYQGISQFEVLANDVLYANDSVIRTLSNFFKGIPYNNSWAYDSSITSVYTSRLRVMTSMYSSVDDFKTWLSTHNTIVYYVLATPTYTEITDTTLLSQLEALAYSYEGTTNISQVNDDLPSELDVVALEDI